jgi:hypothetical protein
VDVKLAYVRMIRDGKSTLVLKDGTGVRAWVGELAWVGEPAGSLGSWSSSPVCFQLQHSRSLKQAVIRGRPWKEELGHSFVTSTNLAVLCDRPHVDSFFGPVLRRTRPVATEHAESHPAPP